MSGARRFALGAGAAAALAAAFAAGYSTGHHARDSDLFASAARYDGYNACLRRNVVERRPEGHGEPHAFYAIFDALFAADDCARVNGLPFLSSLDLYEISGVRWGNEPPPASDAIWRHPDVPRKTLDRGAGWITGLRPAGTWTSGLNR